MNLKEFVKESLSQIIAGVSEAQAGFPDGKSTINPAVSRVFGKSQSGGTNLALGWSRKGYLMHMVEFDVAVTVEEGTQSKGGIGIVTGILGVGAQGASQASNLNQSRIKFAVPIALPSHDDDANK